MAVYFKYILFFSLSFILSNCEGGFTGKTYWKDLKGIDEFGTGKAKLKSTAQLYTGEAIHTHPSGELFWRISFKNGKKHGKALYFHKNGQLANETTFKNGLPQGESISYFESGNIKSKTSFRINGSRIKSESWDEQTGIKIYESSFNKKDEPKLKQAFYPKGRKQRILKYQNGVLIEEKEWYENKSIAKVYIYDQKGEPVSKKTFYSDGQAEKIEQFQENILHGEYVEYFRNGNINRIGHFDRGVREGEFKRYYLNGSLKSEGKYERGKPLFEASYDQSGRKINSKFNWRN